MRLTETQNGGVFSVIYTDEKGKSQTETLSYSEDRKADGEKALAHIGIMRNCSEEDKEKIRGYVKPTDNAVEEDTETRVKCNVCGHIYCYTAADVERNRQNAQKAIRSAVSGMASAIGGTTMGATLHNESAQNSLNRIVDYSRCPKCNSTDIRKLSKEDFEQEQKNASAGSAAVSAADELKKFKELLDMGVITQEEFDAKKKQLLGL